MDITKYMFLNKQQLFNLFILIIFFYISYINSIPYNFFLSSGDFYHYLNLDIFLEKYLSTYSIEELGVSSPYNGWNIFFVPFKYLIYFINIHYSYFPSIFMFIFLSLSYFSFMFSQKLLFENNQNNIFYNLNSIFYSINGFTVYIFWYTWGYSFYLSIYIFAPILFSIFFRFLKDKETISLLIFLKYSLIIFISNIAFANLGWLVHLGTIFFLVVLYFIFNGYNFFVILKKSFIFNFLFCLLILPSLYSIFSFTFSYLGSESSAETYINSYQYVKDQIVSIKDIFYIHNNIVYFQIFEIFKKSSYLYYLVIIFLLIYNFKNSNKFLIRLFLILLLVSLFFLTKGYFLNNDLINFLFAETFLYGFRSSEKIYYFIPFIIFILIGELTNNVKNKLKIFIYILLAFVSLSNAYPLFKGDIYDNFNITALNDNYKIKKNIPEEILDISKIVNQDPESFRILFLPYNRDTSEGWSYHKSLGHNGIDPFHSLFNNSVIGSGTFFTNQKQIINRDFNTSLVEKKWHFNLVRNLGVRYIVYNKNTHDFFIDEINDKIKSYSDEALIDKIYEGNLYELYKVDSKYEYGMIYSPEFIYHADKKNKFRDIDFLENKDLYKKYLYINSTNLNKEVLDDFEKYQVGVNQNFLKYNEIKSFKIPNIEIKNILFDKNRYTIDLVKLSEEGYINLNFRNSVFWKIKCINNCKNFSSNKIYSNQFINSWNISSSSNKLQVIIYNQQYQITKLLWILSFLVTLILSIYYIRHKFV